jgi:hypothetical protein
MAIATDPSIFGRVLTGHDVEQWCLDTLKEWSSTYLAELERQNGIEEGTVPRLRSYATAPSFDNWPEDQLPGLVLISVGLAEAPARSGDGSYNARWQMALGLVVSARTEAESHALAMLYVAAHRALLIQRPSLGGRALGVDWLDEDYAQGSFDDQRSLALGQASFTVGVENVVNSLAGPTTADAPLEPDTTPWPDWPVVQTHEETVEQTPRT